MLREIYDEDIFFFINLLYSKCLNKVYMRVCSAGFVIENGYHHTHIENVLFVSCYSECYEHLLRLKFSCILVGKLEELTELTDVMSSWSVKHVIHILAINCTILSIQVHSIPLSYVSIIDMQTLHFISI